MNTTHIRMRLYQELASLFGSPKQDTHARLMSGVFLGELTELGAKHPCSSVFARETSDVNTLDSSQENDMFALYATTFEVPNPPVSLFESGHLFRDIFDICEDLFRIYEHFGLDFKEGAVKLRPDSLVVELEFMQYLIYLETLQHENIVPLRRAQRDFINRHLYGFSRSLGEKFKNKCIPIYGELSVLLFAFIASEKQFLDEHVVDHAVNESTASALDNP